MTPTPPTSGPVGIADRIDQVIARGQAAFPAADGSLGRQMTDALMWARHTLRQADTDLALAVAVLRLSCECHDHDTPPTDWETGARIPHHCDCPMYPLERPDPEAAPAATADAEARYQQLKTDLAAQQATRPEVPPT